MFTSWLKVDWEFGKSFGEHTHTHTDTTISEENSKRKSWPK
jgi:hypothetical protein